jgi:tRNA threonylcarbamoyladenosine biosynthesis protein TsaE
MHTPILGTHTQHWRHESDCETAARALAALPAVRDAIIELSGALGAGKSTFARHLLRALGVSGRIKSPSYAIVETYELAQPAALAAAHFDFYRFDDPREWEDSGLRELYAAPGLKLVEWPEKAAPLLPPADLRLALSWAAGDERQVRAEALSPRGLALLTALATAAPPEVAPAEGVPR